MSFVSSKCCSIFEMSNNIRTLIADKSFGRIILKSIWEHVTLFQYPLLMTFQGFFIPIFSSFLSSCNVYRITFFSIFIFFLLFWVKFLSFYFLKDFSFCVFSGNVWKDNCDLLIKLNHRNLNQVALVIKTLFFRHLESFLITVMFQFYDWSI